MLLHIGRCCYTSADAVTHREMLLHIGRCCYTSGDAVTHREMLLHIGIVAGNLIDWRSEFGGNDSVIPI